MHQLKGLIWKAYKTRLGSSMSSFVDFALPLIVMITYVILKLTLAQLNAETAGQSDGTSAAYSLIVGDDYRFQRALAPSRALDLRTNFRAQPNLCPKALFYSSFESVLYSQQSDLLNSNANENRQTATTNFGQTTQKTALPPTANGNQIRAKIAEYCGLELEPMSSRESLIQRLSSSLKARINHKQARGKQNNSRTGGCSTILGADGIAYQMGIVVSGSAQDPTFEIHHTDLAAAWPVIYQIHAQGSPFNEYKTPHSDLNMGIYLLELCLSKVIGTGLRLRSSSLNMSNHHQTQTSTENSLFESRIDIDSAKLHIKPFPKTTSAVVVPTLFMVFHLSALLINAAATVLRVAGENESGLRHYIRVSGVSACIYWGSHLIVTTIHMLIQSLVISVLVAIPVTSKSFGSVRLLDPMQETNLLLRWLILSTYSVSLNCHAYFVGSLVRHTSHATLITCLLAVLYSMHPFTFVLQYNPYTFSRFGIFKYLLMLSPCGCYQALMLSMHAIYIQTGEPLQWKHMSMSIPGGGEVDESLSFGLIWLCLLLNGTFWYLATIIFDQIVYSPSKSPTRILKTIFAEAGLCYRQLLGGDQNDKSSIGVPSSQSKDVRGGSKSSKQPKDPNRICCSLRHVSVRGPKVVVVRNKLDHMLPKLQPKIMSRLQPSKTKTQFREGKQIEEPILLDDTLMQHITLERSVLTLDNLNLDFRFNQVSFVLGQTDIKELLFSSLMGLHELQEGYVMLDDIKYTTDNLSRARPEIGSLYEKDVFLNELNIFQNLQFFGSLRDPSYSTYDSESLFVLNLLHMYKQKENSPQTLTSRSGRKLALAVAAVGHTKMLLLVEPTLGLRWRPRCHVLNLLKKYKSIRSILVDTSDVDEACDFGDRVILLKNGRVDFDGSPERLRRKLACGHWLVFEPTLSYESTYHKGSKLLKSPRDKRLPNAKQVQALENLTNQIFKQDKLEPLDPTTRSVYQELMNRASLGSDTGSKVSATSNNASKNQTVRHGGPVFTDLYNDKLHKSTVILKVQHTPRSSQALCAILKVFAAQDHVHGFRLAEMTYESLEDVVVLRMSKAAYPDLPPDLLLSLHHRTQVNDDLKLPRASTTIYDSKLGSILSDRLASRKELFWYLVSFILALGVFCSGLLLLQTNLNQDQGLREIDHMSIQKLYGNSIGFYLLRDNNLPGSSGYSLNGTQTQKMLEYWEHNKEFAGVIGNQFRDNISDFIAAFQRSKDQAVSLIIYDQKTSETTLMFEPNIPHAMTATIKTFVDYEQKLSQPTGTRRKLNTKQYHYPQNWHRIFKGYMSRRFFYGMTLSLAEGLVTASMILAPMRHRAESRVIKVNKFYWFAMALYDFSASVILILGYLALMIAFEPPPTVDSILCIIVIMVIYKMAAIALAYLVSMVAEETLAGYAYLVIIYLTCGGMFEAHLRTFMEWTLYGQGYLYLVSFWVVICLPINAVIEALANINHMHEIDELCSQIPADLATSSSFPSEGPQKYSFMEDLFGKINECLDNDKTGIDTFPLHHRKFGIFWCLYTTIIFTAIVWFFLLYSEKVFGLVARRTATVRHVMDPLKTMVRSTEGNSTSSVFKWDKERDRLVSEYLRCTYEVNYVKHMAENCLYLRIWLKPLGEDGSKEQRVLEMLEPIIELGQPRNEVRVELRTTLQIFIKLGTETSRCKLSRVQILEAYANFSKLHDDLVDKFAVIDWTRETLYKILLHGHYNTKCTPTSRNTNH